MNRCEQCGHIDGMHARGCPQFNRGPDESQEGLAPPLAPRCAFCGYGEGLHAFDCPEFRPPPLPPPAPQPEASLREIWMLIGRIEERTRAGRVVASWKRYVATHQPGAFETQAILSKVALEILCATVEEPPE